MPTRFLPALLLVLTLLAVAPVSAQAPERISYQGVLTDPSGTPVPDGTYAVALRLFDVPAGGAVRYAEDHTVTTLDGVFAAELGGGTPTVGTWDDVAFDDAYWLEVAVGATTLAPRTALLASPYARALTLPFSGSASNASGAALHVTNTDASGTSIGLRGTSASSAGFGLYGEATNATGANFGVYGVSFSPSGFGVQGVALASTGQSIGVYGYTNSASGYAGYFFGRVFSTAEIHAATGGFRFPDNTVQTTAATPFALPFSGSAANGSGAVLAVTNTDASSPSAFGLQGTSASTSGTGVHGAALASTGVNFGVLGQSNSTDGRGVFGRANAATGTTYGVIGENASTTGRGVAGTATAATGVNYGVFGQSTSTDGRGVYGYASAATGTTYAVLGLNLSTNGRGVAGVAIATTGTTVGVYGESASPSGRGVYGTAPSIGVYGEATAATGPSSGVSGQSASTSGRGISGATSAATGVTSGVYGESASTSGRGVFGRTIAATGATSGVYGESASPSGRGVYGTAPSIGVYGEASAATGATYGVYGESASTNGRGVYGLGTATSGANYGVYGETDSPDGYAGYFDGRLYASRSVNSSVNIPFNAYVAHIQNTNAGSEADGLAVQGGPNVSPGAGNIFIGFFDGDGNRIGKITGNGIGGVTYSTTGADLAEQLERLDPAEPLAPGDVVGVFGGRVSRRTAGAERVMVVSTRPAFLGNADGAAAAASAVAFVGQAEVRVVGPVRAGDLLVASGRENGTAVAVALEAWAPSVHGLPLGRAWAGAAGAGEHRINAAVGLDDPALAAVLLARQQAALEAQGRRLDALEARLGALLESE